MQARWFEQCLADVRPDAEWLSADERARLDAFRVPKRREDWRLGRWTAKHAVAAYLGSSADASALAAIEIRPAASGAPEVFVADKRAPVGISLSHREGRAICTAGPPGTLLGCDLEIVEPRCDAFVSDYYTPQERELIARAPHGERFFLLALLWSAKESTLKALREGLRIDPRSIEVSLGDSADAAFVVDPSQETSWLADDWHMLSTRFQQQVFSGWWQCAGALVLTMVSEPESGPPVRLRMAPQLANRPA